MYIETMHNYEKISPLTHIALGRSYLSILLNAHLNHFAIVKAWRIISLNIGVSLRDPTERNSFPWYVS